MNIVIDDAAAARLSSLLREENSDAVVRIRESKIGDGWKSKIVLRLSIDEKEDEDMEGIAQSVPFVIEQELVEQYGDTFLVTLDENTMPVVEAVHTTLWG